MDLIDKLSSIGDRILKVKEQVSTEEATKSQYTPKPKVGFHMLQPHHSSKRKQKLCELVLVEVIKKGMHCRGIWESLSCETISPNKPLRISRQHWIIVCLQ